MSLLEDLANLPKDFQQGFERGPGKDLKTLGQTLSRPGSPHPSERTAIYRYKQQQQGGVGGGQGTAAQGSELGGAPAKVGGDYTEKAGGINYSPEGPIDPTSDRAIIVAQSERNPYTVDRNAPNLETAHFNMGRPEQRRLENALHMRKAQSPGDPNVQGAFGSSGERLDVPEVRANNGIYLGITPKEQSILDTYRANQRDRIDRKLEAERLGGQRREARKIMAEARERIHLAQFLGNPVNPADLEMVKAGATALGNVDDTEKALIAARGVKGRNTAAGQLAYNKLMQQAQKNAADRDLKERRFAFDQSKAGADQQTEMAKFAISLEKLGILDKDTTSKIANREAQNYLDTESDSRANVEARRKTQNDIVSWGKQMEEGVMTKDAFLSNLSVLVRQGRITPQEFEQYSKAYLGE